MPTTADYTLNWGLPKPKGTNLIAGSTQNLRQDIRALADKTDQSITQVNTVANSADQKAEKAAWYKPRLEHSTNLNDLYGNTHTGMHPVSNVTANSPTGSAGWVEVVHDSNAGWTRQRFIESSPNRRQEYTRVRSGGVWQPWQLLSWTSAPITSGTVDDIRVPGLYPLGAAVTGRPFDGPGTLEVWPVDTGLSTVAQVAYRASDSAPEIWRRYISGDNIYAWVKDPSRQEFDTLEARVSNISVGDGSGNGVPRGELDERHATVNLSPAASRPEAMSKDRTRVYTSLATTLNYSDDDGKSWVPIRAFSGVAMESTLVLDNGELLVTGFVGSRNRRVVWVSEGLHTDKETWHEVLEAPHWGIKFTQAWSQATHGRIVLLAEYGPKAGMAWGEVDPVPDGEGAVQLHLSLDYGKTWQVIFNLEDYLVQQHNRPNGDLQHLHGVEWDPYWDRIWLSWGDSMGGQGSNGIAYSDDLGETWETAYTSIDTTGATQVVGIKAMPQCVLFFGDMGVEVSRIDRTQGKDGPHTLVAAYATSDSGMYLCQGHYRAQREGDDAPLLAAFSTEGAAGRDFVVATMDGYHFEVIWQNDNTIPSGRGVRHPIGPTVRGNFFATTNAADGNTGTWASIRMPATGY